MEGVELKYEAIMSKVGMLHRIWSILLNILLLDLLMLFHEYLAPLNGTWIGLELPMTQFKEDVFKS